MRCRRECGLTLIECVVALALLTIVLGTSFGALSGTSELVERIDARLVATRAAESELETLLARPFAALTPLGPSPVAALPPEESRNSPAVA